MAATSQSPSNRNVSSFFQALSFRTSITLLIVLVIAPIFALFLYTNVQDRQAQTQLVESEAIQVAGFAADTQQKVIEDGRQLLVQLSTNPIIRNVNNLDQAACNKFMADQNAQYVQYNAMGVINLKGDIICASVQSKTIVNAKGLRYFEDTVKTQAFTVGDYGIGRLTGKPRINFGYPLLDDAKQLQGVVYVAVDLAWLNNLVSSINLPPNSTFTVIDNQGSVLAQYPDGDKYTGKPADAPIYKTILASKQQGAGESAGLDGVQRLYGFKPLGLDPKNPSAYVAVGVPSSEAFATINQNFTRNLIGLGIILILTLIVGWVGSNALLVRRTNVLLEATKKLSAGDLHARTGLLHNRTELGELAHGFDEMADQLEKQTLELNQARDLLEFRVQERTIQLETVADVSKTAATVLDVEKLLQSVSDLTKTSFNLYHAHIYLLDEQGSKLVLAAGAGEPGRIMKAEGRSIALNNEGSLVARAGRTRQGTIVNDVTQAPDFLPNKLLPDTRSELAVPMLVAERLVGVLDVQSDRQDRFTDADVRVMTTLAAQIAVAVQNARAFAEIGKAKGETELLYNVARRLNGASTRQELLSVVSDYALSQGGTGAALMYIDVDDNNTPEWLEVVADVSQVTEGAALGARYKLADFPFAKLWMSSPEKPILMDDVLTSDLLDETTRSLSSSGGTRASVIMPLYLQGRWVGLVSCSWNKPQDFTEQDRRIYAALGTQLASVVDAVRSSEALAESQQETELLYNVSSRLAGAKTRQELLAAVSDYAIRQGGSGASLMYFDLDEQGVPEWLEMVAEISTVGGGFPVGTRFRLSDFAVANLWLSSPGTPLLIGDTQDAEFVDQATRDAYAQVGQMATAIMPLYQQGRWVGLVQSQWDKPQDFTEQDKRIYTAMGSQLAAVVDAVRSSEALAISQQETEQRAVELETVAEVSTTAASVLDIDALLQTVVDLTKSRFKLYHAHIYLYHADEARLVLAAGAGKAGQVMKAEGRAIALSNLGSLVARAGRSRTGVIENNVTQSPDFLPNPYLPDTRAELAIPMIVGDQLVGVLDIQSESADRFAGSDLSVMTTLAGQIAVAVQNAQSYQQQVQLVDQLQTVDKLKSEFLASMSHELRTPLNSIIGYSRMLLDGADGELEEEMTEDMEAIHNSGQHLLHLINDILDLAKIEAERLEIDPETVDFCAVAEEVTRMTSVLVQDKPVELVLDIEEQLPTLWADPIRLRQILNNLVSNAIKFTEQGEIRIKANVVDNMAVIGVRDTGMGINPDQLERVFERFIQADSSSTRKAGGTGLGLTITRHLVELHGGKIWAESTLGEGTTFWFDIPTTVGMN